MDPLAPNPNLTPPQPKKRWPVSKPVAIIIACVLGVILLGIILFMVFGATNKKAVNTSDSSIYYSRDGYDPKKYQPKIGDPLALNFTAAQKPIELQDGGSIISACSLLTIDELKKEGLTIDPQSAPRSILRSYFDGVGKASYEQEQYTAPNENDAETCNYFLEGPTNLQVTVYQPPMVPASVIASTANERYSRADTSLSSGELYEDKSVRRDDYQVYLIKQGDLALRVQSSLKNQAKREKALQLLAANLASAKTTPKGAPIAEYKTPTFKKSIAKACDLITNDDMKAVTGHDASPIVEEGIASGTGVTQVNDTLYNFIQNECTRRNTGLGFGLDGGEFNQSLNIVTTSYQQPEGAKHQFETIKKEQSEVVAIDGVGDGAFVYKDTAGQNTALLYQGRFVAEIVLNRTEQRGELENPATMAKKLTPFTKEVAKKLNEL